MKTKQDWIIASQTKEDLRKFEGKVVWINQCKRCGREEPVYEGRLEVAISQMRSFIKIHKYCKATI